MPRPAARNEDDDVLPAIRPHAADDVQAQLAPTDRAHALISRLVPLGYGLRARYRLALMHALGQDGAGRWRIRRIQAIVPWLEPASVTALVSDLARVGLLVHDPVSGFYRLPSDVRVLVALVDALAAPDIAPRRIVRIIGQAISLARATGTGREIIHAQFRSAMAALRAGELELRQLLDDFSPHALHEAGEALADNAEDMRALLREHADLFSGPAADDLLPPSLEQEALELIARTATLAGETISLRSNRIHGRLTLAGRIDRSDLVELTMQLEEEQLAALLSGLVVAPPGVPAVDTDLAFAALEEMSGRPPHAPPPLPAPTTAVRRSPPEQADPTDALRAELVALRRRLPIAEIVARVDFPHAVRTQVDLMSLYATNDPDLPRRELRAAVRTVGHAGVARMSDSYLDPEDA
jgi:hypothetical protein